MKHLALAALLLAPTLARAADDFLPAPLGAPAKPAQKKGAKRQEPKATPAAAPAKPAPAADDFVPAPIAPPPPPVEPVKPPPGFRVIEAHDDKPRQDEAVTAKVDASSEERRRLRVNPRLGVMVPRTELHLGPLAGAEASYLLPLFADVPLLADHLRVGLAAGYSLVTYKGPRVVPGRGYDPAFIQNTTLVPVELMATYDLVRTAEGLEVSAGAGYGLYYTRSDVETLGAAKVEPAFASALVLTARVAYPAGPGSLLLDVRHAELKADLGPVQSFAQTTFSGTSLTAGYALDLL